MLATFQSGKVMYKIENDHKDSENPDIKAGRSSKMHLRYENPNADWGGNMWKAAVDGEQS